MVRIELWVDPLFWTCDQYNVVGQRDNGELVSLYVSPRFSITSPEIVLDRAMDWVAGNVGGQGRFPLD